MKRFRSSAVVVFVCVGLVAVASCAEAGGQVNGGELTEAGTQASEPPDFVAPLPEYAVKGSGTKWSDLYRDIFGPEGEPSCTKNGSCHGPNGDGARSGSGIVCFDEKGCRSSLIEKGLVATTNASAPEKANVFAILRTRKPNGKIAGIMPKAPEGIFPEASLERIRTWIRNGLTDD